MVVQLSNDAIFPPAKMADETGLLAIGGDLSPERILLAYRNGIFPWYNSNTPILWWSPDPRMVLYPNDLKVSKSLKQVIRGNKFIVTFDADFEQVIRSCSEVPRKDQQEGDGWLTEEMIRAYVRLHELGWAHSVEVWQDEKIVGGLYGIALGACFFGESMFTKVSNASKVGFCSLVHQLKDRNFTMIDCQVATDHLQRLGAIEISRKRFIREVELAVDAKNEHKNWSDW